MKKLLSIILILAVTNLFSQELGTIYAKNKFINTNAYGSIIGTGSYFSVTGNKLVVNGGPGVTGYAKRMICDTVGMGDFCYSKWTYTIYTTIDSKGSGSDYIAFGVTANNTIQNNWLVFKFWTLTAKAGKAEIIRSSAGAVGTICNTASTATTVTAGVRYKFVMTRIDNVITFAATNLNTSTTSTANWTCQYSSVSRIYGQGKFSIYSAQNTAKHSIDSINVYIKDSVNVKTIWWGDSITQGYDATSIDSTYAKQAITFAASSIGLHNLAISGNRTQELLNSIQNIVTLAPQYCVIMIGLNDRVSGVPTLTWQANLSSIRSTLINAGIQPVWLHCIPSNANNITPVNAYIDATFTSDSIVPTTYDSLKGTGTGIKAIYTTDGKHLNDAGCRKAAIEIAATGAYLF